MIDTASGAYHRGERFMSAVHEGRSSLSDWTFFESRLRFFDSGTVSPFVTLKLNGF